MVLVPGFLSDWRAYADVAEALERSLARATGGRRRGRRAVAGGLRPTLAGGDFSVIVDAIDASVRKCSARSMVRRCASLRTALGGG